MDKAGECYICTVKEIKAIIEAYEQAQAADIRTALATVVHVEGSSYRRPGARMLVTDEGNITGAISGGCLEGDALRKAQLVIAQQQPKLVIYDTRDEEDAFIGRQLGCAGLITVLFEPIDSSHTMNALECLRQQTQHRSPQIRITIFSLADKQATPYGTCFWQQGTQQWGKLPDELDRDQINEDIAVTLQKQVSHFCQYPNGSTVFFEYIPAAVSLVLVGAGNDVLPMAQFADILGWEVHVVDGRATHARTERFPLACQVLAGKPETLIEKIPFDSRTAIVLMTHNYQYDLSMFRLLIEKPVAYIGILGPAKKRERMFTELGRTLTAAEQAIVYGPTGLNIGAETPEEIALSVLSEIQAVLRKRKPEHLAQITDTIHDRSETLIKSRSWQ